MPRSEKEYGDVLRLGSAAVGLPVLIIYISIQVSEVK